jgi:hypothetical protein
VVVRETLELMARIEALLPQEMRPTDADKAHWVSALAPATDE